MGGFIICSLKEHSYRTWLALVVKHLIMQQVVMKFVLHLLKKGKKSKWSHSVSRTSRASSGAI
jgi:hypothetical protein